VLFILPLNLQKHIFYSSFCTCKLCIFLDEDLLKVETCRKDIDYLLFILQFILPLNLQKHIFDSSFCTCKPCMFLDEDLLKVEICRKDIRLFVIHFAIYFTSKSTETHI
jgi:hypothetical protein